ARGAVAGGRVLLQLRAVAEHVVAEAVPVARGTAESGRRRRRGAIAARRGPGLGQPLQVIGAEALMVAGGQLRDPGDVPDRVVRVADVRDGGRSRRAGG